MSKSIYNIKNEYLELSNQIIDAGGELSPELEYSIQINKDELETKGVGYSYVILQMEAEADIIDAEIKRLTNLKKAKQTVVDRLKQNLTDALNLFGIDEIKTALLKINFRKSEQVIIEDMSILDQRFISTKITQMPDKVAIKKAIKDGEVILGAYITENQNLQIK